MITAKRLPPQPGIPKVEFIEPDLARWTFTSTDRGVQEAEFSHWCGWFGFDETDRPSEVTGDNWLVRRSPAATN